MLVSSNSELKKIVKKKTGGDFPEPFMRCIRYQEQNLSINNELWDETVSREFKCPEWRGNRQIFKFVRPLEEDN